MSVEDVVSSDAAEPVESTSQAHNALKLRGDVALVALADTIGVLDLMLKRLKANYADIKRADISMGIKDDPATTVKNALDTLRASDSTLQGLSDEELYTKLKGRTHGNQVPNRT